MASYRNENRPDSGDLLSWIITIVLLVSPVWPIGLILLLRKLTGGSRRRASRHPYDIQREGGPVPGTQGMPGAQRQTPPVGRQHVGRSIKARMNCHPGLFESLMIICSLIFYHHLLNIRNIFFLYRLLQLLKDLLLSLC